MAVKYSRQREAIKNYLFGRKDHPTAEAVYEQVRKTYPNISLGTVYRNLTMLSNNGDIRRINVGNGVDRFDPDTTPHAHFLCAECGALVDIFVDVDSRSDEITKNSQVGEVYESITYYYGKCSKCCKKHNEK